MKSERRHELQESDLIHALESGKSYLQGHGKNIALIGVAVVAVIIVANVVMNSQSAEVENRWLKVEQLSYDTPETAKQSLGTLLDVSQEAGSESLAVNTLIKRADRALREFNKAEQPDPEFNNIARDSYQRLLDEHASNRLAFGVAHLGLATCAENQFALDGDHSHRDTALSHIEKVLNRQDLQTTPLYGIAMDRKKSLEQVFVQVTFDPPLPEEETADETPEPITVELTPDQIQAPPGFKVTPGKPTADPSTDKPADDGAGESDPEGGETP